MAITLAPSIWDGFTFKMTNTPFYYKSLRCSFRAEMWLQELFCTSTIIFLQVRCMKNTMWEERCSAYEEEMLPFNISVMSPASNRVKGQADNYNSKFLKKWNGGKGNLKSQWPESVTKFCKRWMRTSKVPENRSVNIFLEEWEGEFPTWSSKSLRDKLYFKQVFLIKWCSV